MKRREFSSQKSGVRSQNKERIKNRRQETGARIQKPE